MTFAPPLTQAVDRLYAAFEGSPPASVPHCDHCVSDEEVARLLTAGPVRLLPAEVLRPYAANLVVGTAGSPDDARYFLPRVCEVSLDSGAWPDLVLVARYVGRTDLGLDDRQRAAVAEFFRAVWWDVVTTDPLGAGLSVDEALCAAAHGTGDLTPVLAEWTRLLDRPHPRAHLLYLVSDADRDGDGWRLRGSWWDDHDRRVDLWLRSAELRTAVDRATAGADDVDAVVLRAHLGYGDGTGADPSP